MWSWSSLVGLVWCVFELNAWFFIPAVYLLTCLMEASAVLAPLQVLQLRWKGSRPPRATLHSPPSRIFHLSDQNIESNPKKGHMNKPLEFLVLLFHAFPIMLLFLSLISLMRICFLNGTVWGSSVIKEAKALQVICMDCTIEVVGRGWRLWMLFAPAAI